MRYFLQNDDNIQLMIKGDKNVSFHFSIARSFLHIYILEKSIEPNKANIIHKLQDMKIYN